MISQVSTNFNTQTHTVPRSFSNFVTAQRGYYLQSATISKEEKKAKSNKLGLAIASTALALGFSVLALVKGLPKGSVQKLDGIKQFLEKKLAQVSDSAKHSKMVKFYEFLLKKVESASEYFNSVNNATTFKDVLFGKLMNKTKFTRKLAEKTTALFEKFSRKTVLNSYENAHYRFNRMFEVFGAADNKIIAQNPDKLVTINGKTQTAKEWLKVIAEKRLDMSQTFNSYFGKNAVRTRYTETKNTMKGLDKKLWDLSFGNIKENLKNKDMYDTFLPEAILSKDKAKLKATVDSYKNIITGSSEKTGQLDDVLTIYKELLPPEEFNKLQRYSEIASQKLNRAVVLETDKFFDKLRDLKLGCAPTDVLSMVTGLGAVGIGLTKAEDNEDRISVALKYGIPALGTIGTSLYLGATLVSGGKAFVYSTLSGLAMNKIGTKVDEYLDKRREEKSTAKAV